jgi:hypothetical protein
MSVPQSEKWMPVKDYSGSECLRQYVRHFVFMVNDKQGDSGYFVARGDNTFVHDALHRYHAYPEKVVSLEGKVIARLKQTIWAVLRAVPAKADGNQTSSGASRRK